MSNLQFLSRESLARTNAAFKLPTVPGIERHIAEMRAIAAQSPVECARVVDWHTGATLWESSPHAANAKQVDVGDAVRRGFTRGNLIIHTHPLPAELSLDDFACCVSAGAAGNMAVCANDETVSWCGPLQPWVTNWGQLDAAAWVARLNSGIDLDKVDLDHPDLIAVDNATIAQQLVSSHIAGAYFVRYSPHVVDELAGYQGE